MEETLFSFFLNLFLSCIRSQECSVKKKKDVKSVLNVNCTHNNVSTVLFFFFFYFSFYGIPSLFLFLFEIFTEWFWTWTINRDKLKKKTLTAIDNSVSGV